MPRVGDRDWVQGVVECRKMRSCGWDGSCQAPECTLHKKTAPTPFTVAFADGKGSAFGCSS